MAVNLNALTIEKLNEILPQIDDLELLKATAAKETRVSAKKLFEERIAALQDEGSQPQEKEAANTPQKASGVKAPSSVESGGKVRVKLVNALSYQGRGISLKKNEIREVSAETAKALLGTGFFEEVVREERRE